MTLKSQSWVYLCLLSAKITTTSGGLQVFKFTFPPRETEGSKQINTPNKHTRSKEGCKERQDLWVPVTVVWSPSPPDWSGRGHPDPDFCHVLDCCPPLSDFWLPGPPAWESPLIFHASALCLLLLPWVLSLAFCFPHRPLPQRVCHFLVVCLDAGSKVFKWIRELTRWLRE